jgi:hypothetical protein
MKYVYWITRCFIATLLFVVITIYLWHILYLQRMTRQLGIGEYF